MDGLRRTGRGSLEMVRGALQVISDEHTQPALRLALIEAVRDHVGTFTRAWTPDERSSVADALRVARAAERDSNVATALAEARAAVGP